MIFFKCSHNYRIRKENCYVNVIQSNPEYFSLNKYYYKLGGVGRFIGKKDNALPYSKLKNYHDIFKNYARQIKTIEEQIKLYNQKSKH